MANFTKKSNFNLDSFTSSLRHMIDTSEASYLDYYSDTRTGKTALKDYTLDEIDQIVNGTSLIAKINLSRNYFYKDGFYKRIITYYATILKYAGILIPNPGYKQSLSKTHIQKKYYSALDFVEDANLQNILKTISLKVLIDGSYYGVVSEAKKKKLTIINLPTQYCRSRFQNEDGLDMVEFDLGYFDSILDTTSRNKALAMYPKVISNAYRRYHRNTNFANRWMFVPSDMAIYFTLSDGYPFFLHTIPATIQYDEAVDTERERELEEIRKIIVQKIPHITATGELLFEPEEAAEIHAGTVAMMRNNPNVSVLTTYAEVDSIVSKNTSDNVSNNLEKMMNNIFYEAGASPQIFAGTGNLALENALKNDLALMMILGDKYSEFGTRVVNKVFGNTQLSFTYKILPISYYNDQDFMNDTFKLTSTGYSFTLPALAAGLSQRDLVNLKDLENTVMKLNDKLIPLSSSFTQPGDAGAPAKAEEDKSEKTIENEESIDNGGTGGSD